MKNYSLILCLALSTSLSFGPLLGASVAYAKTNTTEESVKRISKAPAPKEEVALEEGDEHAVPADSAKKTAKKPTVATSPAPGTKSDSGHDKGAAAHGAAAGHGHQETKVVEPDQSLKWLANGNERYLTRKTRSDGRSAVDRKRLLAGQHPHAIILSCADSRVPPETVFDQALGEIFTIRVAGEALDSSVIASVEYAVEHLGPHLLVVMGHTQCGAVDTALKVKEGDSAGSESLDKLLADIRPRLKSIPADKISPNLEVESTVNADGVARDILKRSEIIRKKVESGDLVIKAALYRMDSGKVTFY